MAVDASSIGGKTDEKHNRKNALNRQEFVQALVKCACMKYVKSGEVVDVSDALHRMFSRDIDPRMDPKVFCEPNEFRTAHTYTEPVDTVLRSFETSLRLLFDRACKLRGQSAAAGIRNKLVRATYMLRDCMQGQQKKPMRSRSLHSP